MIESMYAINKGNIHLQIAFSLGVAIADIAALFLLQNLVDLVADSSHLDQTQLYILVLLIGILWLVKCCFSHNLEYESTLLVENTKQGLNLMMYEKISQLSQSIVDAQELGKITNIFSNDFNQLTAKFPSLMFCPGLLLRTLGIIVILIWRFGWMALWIVFIFTLFFLLQIGLGKLQAKY